MSDVDEDFGEEEGEEGGDLVSGSSAGGKRRRGSSPPPPRKKRKSRKKSRRRSHTGTKDDADEMARAVSSMAGPSIGAHRRVSAVFKRCKGSRFATVAQ